MCWRWRRSSSSCQLRTRRASTLKTQRGAAGCTRALTMTKRRCTSGETVCDTLCHPVDEHIQCWPEKPARYRELLGKYSVEVRKLSMLLLELIGEGLGQESGFFKRGELNRVQLMALNCYPRPNPSLTLGSPRHGDVNLITVLLQGPVHGLQVLNDGQWLALQPLPDAFVINIGLALQIISKGKLRSAEHRVTTNRTSARTTVTTFIHPSGDCLVEPAKVMTNNHNPPLYRSFLYKDFLSTYIVDTYEGKPPLKRYIL